MFKKSNAGDQLLLAVKLNKVAEISRLVALGVDVNSRIDKVNVFVIYSPTYLTGFAKGCLHSNSCSVYKVAKIYQISQESMTFGFFLFFSILSLYFCLP